MMSPKPILHMYNFTPLPQGGSLSAGHQDTVYYNSKQLMATDYCGQLNHQCTFNNGNDI